MAARVVTRSPLRPTAASKDICLETQDHSVLRRSAVEFFGLRQVRDPHEQAARVSRQFVDQNRSLLAVLDARAEVWFDGRDLILEIHTGNGVGAIPLLSPASARMDVGLVVQPRFAWPGIGPMLAEMGWRVSPTPLRLPLLHRSERRVPPWVLASMILIRLQALLFSLDRRFEMTREERVAPKSRVDWSEYARNRLSRLQVLSIPCAYPDLREDRQLKGTIRFALERQMRALDGQRLHGGFVHQLIALAEGLYRRVRMVPASSPTPQTMESWQRRPMRAAAFANGITAICWTAEDRGLARASDLEGVPWALPMDAFFEAWVETVLLLVARKTGGRLKTGRKRETVQPIRWDLPYLGSQKALIPDLQLEWDDLTLVVDARYKRHWEGMQQHSWARAEELLREQHRHDLLQVLAYANLARTARVVVCLAYPCAAETWRCLQERNRLLHRAEIASGARQATLWLTAVPMAAPGELVAVFLAAEVKRVRRGG